MEYRTLGRNGPRVSRNGLGCNNFSGRLDFEGTIKVVHKALDLGITLFDTSDSYGNKLGHIGGSEEFLGRILGHRRKDIVLATKFGWPMDKEGKMKGASRSYIMHSIEGSLRRLKTDWIDLYQMHLPDPETPIEETLRALDDLVRQGKVRFIGCSNLSGAELTAALETSGAQGLAAFITCQNEYNVLSREIEADLLPVMESYGLGLVPAAPLAAGLLTGKYQAGVPMPDDGRLNRVGKAPRSQRFVNDANWRRIEALRDYSAERGHTLLELAFGWLFAHPVLASVIAGAMKPAQVEQNVAASNWTLDATDVAEVDRITRY
jgi:aryl-alcohol dehydrogenase-like predicted oxidoreductase